MGEWFCPLTMLIWVIGLCVIKYFEWKTALSKERRMAIHADFYSKHCEGCNPCDEHDCPDAEEREDGVTSSEG